MSPTAQPRGQWEDPEGEGTILQKWLECLAGVIRESVKSWFALEMELRPLALIKKHRLV